MLALTKPARLYVTRLRAREALTTPVSLAKIDSDAMETVQFAPRRGTRSRKFQDYNEKMVEQKGFEPSTPTLRT